MPQKNEKKNKAYIIGGSGVALGGATELRRRSYQYGKGDPNKITIIHSPAEKGAGHKAVAEALKERLEAKGVEVQVLDTKNAVNTKIKNKFYGGAGKGYAEQVQRNPAEAFNSSFLKSKKKRTIADKVKGNLADLYYEGRSEILGESAGLRKQIKKFKPGKVVTTYFGSVPGLADMNKRVDTVVTDYVPSPNLWKKKNAGKYFVPTDEAKNIFKAHGISDKHITVIGDIPAKYDKNLKNVKNLNPKNITVMGGGLGLRTEEVGPIVADYLKKKGHSDSTVTVLPGKGDTVAREYLSREKLPKNLKVVGTGETSFSKYMKDADLVITRPGGATTSELRGYGKPSITFSEFKESAPYHESGNVRTLNSGGHNVHAILSKEKYQKGKNTKALHKALDEAFNNYGKMFDNAQKTKHTFSINQDKLVDKILASKAMKNTETSKITKAGRVGAGALVGAGLYNYMNKSAEAKDISKVTGAMAVGGATSLSGLALRNAVVGNSSQNSGLFFPYTDTKKYVAAIKDRKNLQKLDKHHKKALKSMENLGADIDSNKSVLSKIKNFKSTKQKINNTKTDLVNLSKLNEKLKVKHGVKDLAVLGNKIKGGNASLVALSGGVLGGLLLGLKYKGKKKIGQDTAL